jgi:hypothetical protein
MRDDLGSKSFKRPKEMVRIWTFGKEPDIGRKENGDMDESG